MPTFNREVEVETYADVELDIDVEDYFDEMTIDEKEQMKNLLSNFKINIDHLELHHLEDEAILKEFIRKLCTSSLNINYNLMIEEIKYFNILLR